MALAACHSAEVGAGEGGLAMRADEHSAEPPSLSNQRAVDTASELVGDVSPFEPGLREVLYTLEWTLGEATLHRDGSTWSVINDRGFEVVVEEGWLVSASVQLVPCEGEAEPGETAGALDTLMRWFAIPEARAEHFGGLEDVSAVLTPIAEPLLGPSQLDIGPIAVGGLRYCAMHYLVNKATSNTRNLPESPTLSGVSLHLKGSYRFLEDPDAEAIPLAVSCSMPVGMLPDLESPPPDASRFEWEDDGTDLHVTITRQLGRLFDGVDFMAMSSDGVELRLLKSLSAQAEVTARRVAEP